MESWLNIAYITQISSNRAASATLFSELYNSRRSIFHSDANVDLLHFYLSPNISRPSLYNYYSSNLGQILGTRGGKGSHPFSGNYVISGLYSLNYVLGSTSDAPIMNSIEIPLD